MKSLQDLVDRLDRSHLKTVAVAQAAEREVLKAVKQAHEKGVGHFLLVGECKEIQAIASEIGLELTDRGIMVKDCPASRAAIEAVKAVNNQEAQVLMKGYVETKTIMKAVLDKQYGLRTDKVLSHVALFEVPNQQKLIFLTDSAMNIAPTLQEKIQIINNAVAVANKAGWEKPKVALLTAVEVVNPDMPATQDAAVLTQMNRRGQIKRCIVDGPLAFDNAVDPRAAKQKGIQSEVAGSADMLMVPTIEVANALYKSFVYFAGAKVAGVISGAKAPIVLTSRADTAENKVYSLALALQSSE